MISFFQFTTGVAMGCILIVIGFVPGLVGKWSDALSDFADSFMFRFAVASRTRTEFGQQRWLGALGMALIALSLFLYVSR
jgi:hypothetical protein